MALLVGIWIARYLGPAQYGLLSFSLAFVSLFTAIATLGLPNVIVREFVNRPHDRDIIIGTAFFLRLIGGVAAAILVVAGVFLVRPDDQLSRLIVTILSFQLVAKSSEVIKNWFESKVRSKYTVFAELGAYLVVAITKIALILVEAPLMYFVWAYLFQFVLTAVLLFIMYFLTFGTPKWLPRIQEAQRLLKESWPLIISGLVIMIYMRIDQVMIGQMLDDESVGIYSVAVRLSEIWYFIPTAIAASVFPNLLKTRQQSKTRYHEKLQMLLDTLVVLSLMIAVPMTFLATGIVSLLFGSEYSGAGPVLSIHIWAAVFVFMAMATSKWRLAEGLQYQSAYRNPTGAALNVGLNFLLIPKYGITGAAVASLAAQALPGFIFDAFDPKCRYIMIMRIKAISLYSPIKRVISEFVAKMKR
jgi:O-antigen/teichoic acid export membrane protein